MFAVFLDVDGVLNTETTVTITPEGYKGINEFRVEILANALADYGEGEIVLSSDWKELGNNSLDFMYLKEKLLKYGLEIVGKTTDEWRYRGAGIIRYLEKHPEIDEYVILDDNRFDFKEYPKLWERLLLTKGIENAQFASGTPAVEALVFLDLIRKY